MQVASLSNAAVIDAQAALASPRYVAATYSKSKQGAKSARNKAKVAMSSFAKTTTSKAAKTTTKSQMRGVKKATSSN